ncbi:hypothetical protein [Mariniradius sediminis]|uniref:Uncharacterized protein n=1 Tax=Mariniradius sediminis TaxID=2909237 RepID=A0ABS9BSM0_9BACT|nr:hypothetical protein [Mariniradius sediminis]MCF1751076.1 hypothetical protein [Mariniradius sediminis]
MKKAMFLVFISCIGISFPVWSQDNENADTVANRSVNRADLPAILLNAIHEDSLQGKAALFFINESAHPLGKAELKDQGKTVKYLKTPIRMNRITLIYVPAGSHRFQTIYMKKFEELTFKAGEIYIAALITTSTWPVPYAFVKEDRFGREYVPVLFMYINGEEAAQMLVEIKNQEIVLNQK